ncbi:MAG: hypothetical protein LBP33_13640 [Candidatus Adiutrix sp.]|jgi:TolB protein|nr:hypothetical protein [Candidatus Adiutrix sp.]
MMFSTEFLRPGRLTGALWLVLLLAAPAWAEEKIVISPGTCLIFAAGEREQRSIMMVDPAGGRPAVLADLEGALDSQPAVGPQGQLAWIRQNGPDWELMENGRAVSGGALHLSPAYSPDGTLAAAVSGAEETSIFAFRDGGRKILAAGGPGGLAVSPSFSPDGSRLAYVSNHAGRPRIYVTAPGSGSPGSALWSSPTANSDPDWSPDGRYIVFVSDEKDIGLIRPDGRDFRQLTSKQGVNGDPAFSPDGQLIVFSSDRDGLRQLWVMRPDGSGQRPLLPGWPFSQSLPVWSAVRPAQGKF